MNRVFLDANVVFSAAWRENGGLLRLWQSSDTTLLTSRYAYEEAFRNLETEEQRQRLTKGRVGIAHPLAEPRRERWAVPTT